MTKKTIKMKTTDQLRETENIKAAPAIDAWVLKKTTLDTEIEKRLSLTISDSLHRKFKQICALDGITIKDKIVQLITDHLESKK